MSPEQKPSPWTPAWGVTIVTGTAVAVVLAARAGLLPVRLWALPAIAAAGAGMTWMVTLVQRRRWPAHAYRVLAWLTTGAWATWAAVAGWTTPVLAALPVLGLLAIGGHHLTHQPDPTPTNPDDPTPTSGRTPAEQRWEALLRQLTRQAVRVTRTQPWERPEDGVRVHLDLPIGMTVRDLTDATSAIAAACKLPRGCAARVLDGDHQGEAVIDVMLRDCLADEVVAAEDYTPASINDPFTVATSPRGEPLAVCMRQQSVVIGGTVGSGKTTLLNRMIMHLARCTDTLIWVIDLNGGGVAEPWISPWATGDATRPVVDWVADSEEEGAVLVATAIAIAKDRKTSPAARARRRAANSTVLPVDADLPAIVVLTDEGGEVRQAVSLLGQMVAGGISRIAQIGRAEGVRVVMSVLRGTADLLDKAMRVNASIRICLRMEEDGEYVHILGMEPSRTRLIHVGSAFVLRGTDQRPILARTVNVLLDAIDRAVVACAQYRPDLDERARLVASRLTPADILGGREPSPEMMELPPMRDVAAGLGYEGRWERYARKLAEMRGEEAPEVEHEPTSAPTAPPPATPAPVAPASTPTDRPGLGALLAAAGAAASPQPRPVGVDVADNAAVDAEAAALLADIDWTAAAKLTARDHILAVLRDAYPEGMTSAQIGVQVQARNVQLSHGHRHEVLAKLYRDGAITKDGPVYRAVTP